MPGALEWFSDPANQGLLNLSAGLLNAGGPSPRPVSFGQALGQGLQQGTGAFQTAQQAQTMNRLHGLQAGALAQNLQKNQQTQGALQAFAETLPPEQRPAFLAAPDVFIKERFAPYTLKPGEARFVGGGQVAAVPEQPKLEDVPVAGKPGFTQKMWLRPGETSGAVVGGEKAPDILNPDVEAARARIATAGANNVINNVNAFTPASEAAQRDFMDKTAKNYEALRTAPVMLQNIAKAQEIAKSGNPFVGSFGEQKAAVAQFFNNNFGTNIAPDQIADAGELKNRLFQQIMENLKKMDAQPSEMQQKLMMDALGNINSDPRALQKIMSVTDEVIRGKVDIHNKEVKSGIDRGVRFPYDPIISLPDKPKEEPVAKAAPKKGEVRDGWEYVGGDPASRMSWKKR